MAAFVIGSALAQKAGYRVDTLQSADQSDQLIRRGHLLSGHQAGDDLTAVPPVDFKVAVSCDEHRVGQHLGHSDKASIRQAHWDASVFGAQVEDLCQLIPEIKPQAEVSLSQELIKRKSMRWMQKKKGLRHNRIASYPRQRLAGQCFASPCVVFLARIKQCG